MAPMTHITIPKYINAFPLIPPSPLNCTGPRSGILMSASLANALLAKPNKQIARSIQDIFLALLIDFCGARLCKHIFQRQPFLAKLSPNFVIEFGDSRCRSPTYKYCALEINSLQRLVV